MTVFVILQNTLHVRNFVTSRFASMFKEKGIVAQFFAPNYTFDTLKEYGVDEESIFDINFFYPSKLKKIFIEFSSSCSVIQRRDFNSTYADKFLQTKRYSTKSVKRFLFFYLSLLLCKFIDVEKFLSKLFLSFSLNQTVEDAFEKHEPDVVFIPSLIYEVAEKDFILSAKKRQIPVYEFVTSWDNLTSKGFFLIKPEKLLVWGQKDKESAVKEHFFSENQVEVVGAPHFDVYSDISQKKQERELFLKARDISVNKEIILFGGTTFNKYASESDLVKRLALVLEVRLPGKYVIWYRPHPRTFNQEIDKELFDISNLILDEYALNAIKTKTIGFSDGTDSFEYYRTLLKVCDICISVFSTMVIECALHGVPSVLVNFRNSNKSGKNERNAFYEYGHIKYIRTWKGISFAENIDEIVKQISRFSELNIDSEFRNTVREEASQVAYNLDGKAKERIIGTILGSV